MHGTNRTLVNPPTTLREHDETQAAKALAETASTLSTLGYDSAPIEICEDGDLETGGEIHVEVTVSGDIQLYAIDRGNTALLRFTPATAEKLASAILRKSVESTLRK